MLKNFKCLKKNKLYIIILYYNNHRKFNSHSVCMLRVYEVFRSTLEDVSPHLSPKTFLYPHIWS